MHELMNEWMNECLNGMNEWMFEWMNVQGGEAEDLPGGDDWRGGVQVRDHIPRHVHLITYASEQFSNKRCYFSN